MSAAENSVRADLEAAIKQHREPPAEVEKVEPVVAETTAEVEKTTGDRPRDEKGRFAAKETTDDARGKPGDAANGVAGTGKADTAGQQQPVQAANGQDGKRDSQPQPEAALAPPNGWSAQAKAVWHTLSREVQEAAVQREKDIAKFASTRDEHASFGKEVYQAVQPYLAQIQAEGATPATAIKSLLNTAYVLRVGTPEQKKQLLLNTARQYGVDLGQAQADPTKPAQPISPEFASLRQELDALKGHLTQQQQAEHNRVQAEATAELEAFAADPTHQYFQEVKAHMAALFREGLAKDLQDAYDQATWARPDIRATLEAQRRADEEQKRIADAKAKAEAARKRAVSVTGGPGNTASTTAPASKGSVREDIMAAMEAHSGAV